MSDQLAMDVAPLQPGDPITDEAVLGVMRPDGAWQSEIGIWRRLIGRLGDVDCLPGAEDALAIAEALERLHAAGRVQAQPRDYALGTRPIWRRT